LPLKEGHISVTHQESAVKDAQDWKIVELLLASKTLRFD
jgi:hypothetical protein